MKKTIILILVAMIATTLFSIIDRTFSIDTQLLQQIRENLTEPYPDPLIGDYIYYGRNDPGGSSLENTDNRVVYFNEDIVGYSRDALYQAI